jgi:hypothetical protein
MLISMLLFAQATGRIFRCSTVVNPLSSPVTSETVYVVLIIAESAAKINPSPRPSGARQMKYQAIRRYSVSIYALHTERDG